MALESLNLESLGVSGIAVGIVIAWNWQLRKDLAAALEREQAERDYSKDLSESYRASGAKTIEMIGKLEHAFMLLRDGLK